MRLTLRTLLAYLDDTLPPEQAKAIGHKAAESETAGDLIERIKKVTRRRGLSTPTTGDSGSPSDPNTVADYLSDSLSAEQIAQFEKACLDSDVHLAEVAACHQILTLLLSEPVRVPPTARQRMYQLVRGPESQPNRKPGRTLPVAGELPEQTSADADDADAAFLLGMRAYSRSDSWRDRLSTLATVLGLVACLALTVWLALPTSPAHRESTTPRADGSMVVVNPGEVAKPVDGASPSQDRTGSTKPVVKSLEIAPHPSPIKEEGASGAGKPVEQPAGELVPALTKPKGDRIAVARLDNPDAMVVTRSEERDGRWLRLNGTQLDVFSTDRVVCLPGYKAKVRVAPALEFELWANLPEQQRFIPVLETAVTFYRVVDGFDAELALHSGRVYLTAKRPTGAKVRLRFRDEIWDITLPDDKTEIAVEAINTLVAGMSRDIDPSEAPELAVGLAVVKGSAALKVRYKDIPQVRVNELVSWTSKGPGLQGPTKLMSTHFSRFELSSVGEEAKAAQQALNELSKRATDRESARIAFAELLRDDGAIRSSPRVAAAGARIAVLGHAALGDLPPIIDALNDSNRATVRGAAAFALSTSLAVAPERVDQFRRQLADKLSLSDDQTALCVQLLRGPSEAERRNPQVINRLIDALSSNSLVIRELAFAATQGMIDPATPPKGSLLAFNAAAPAEERDMVVKAWRKYLDDLAKKKPTDSKDGK